MIFHFFYISSSQAVIIKISTKKKENIRLDNVPFRISWRPPPTRWPFSTPRYAAITAPGSLSYRIGAARLCGNAIT